MQTETHALSGLELNPTDLLSFAMTALRLSVSKPKREKFTPTGPDSIITLEEISWHDNEKDCWVIIYDRVYDLTNFFDEVIISLYFPWSV